MAGMDGVSGLKQSLLELLERSGRFPGARLLAEYPAEERDYPLRRPAVAVGIHGVSLAGDGLGGYYGERAGGAEALYGGGAVITLRFDLFAPRGESGGGCQSLFEALCDLLVWEGAGGLRFHRTWCGPVEYDQTLDAYHLAARAQLRAALTRGDTSLTVSGFQVARRKD